MPTDQPDQTEPRDATDAVRRGLADALKAPGKRTPWAPVPPVRDGDSNLRRGLIAALTPTTTDEENQP